MVFLETVLTGIIIFAVLIFFHELGHFSAAKLFKMKVEEFAFGLPFGPKVATLFNDGETEYTIRAIPLGGFVRIAGMDEFDDAKEPKTLVTGNKSGFNERPKRQRFAVVFAGPLFSLILGYLAMSLYIGIDGIPIGDKMNFDLIRRKVLN